MGARALVGSPRINGFLELLGQSRDSYAAPDQETTPENGESGLWSTGVEARIAEGLWASVGFGNRFATSLGTAEKTFVLLGLRWGISSAARMDALRPTL